MLNNSLSISRTIGYSGYTLLIQPYKEGWNNFKIAIGKQELISQLFTEKAPNGSWTQTFKNTINKVFHFTKHTVIGSFLCIPLVNTIIMLFLRNFNRDSEEHDSTLSRTFPSSVESDSSISRTSPSSVESDSSISRTSLYSEETSLYSKKRDSALLIYIQKNIQEVESEHKHASPSEKIEIIFNTLTEKLLIDFPRFEDLLVLNLAGTNIDSDLIKLIYQKLYTLHLQNGINFLRNNYAHLLPSWDFSTRVDQKIIEIYITADKRLSPSFVETEETDQTPLINTILDCVTGLGMYEDSLQYYLSHFLDAFVEPFIQGSKDLSIESGRVSLLEAVKTNIKFFDPNADRELVQEKLLELYIEKNIQVIKILNNSEITELLMEDLEATLPIDFPNLVISKEQLTEKIKALNTKILIQNWLEQLQKDIRSVSLSIKG